jgi:hypothetical protein
MTTPGPQPTHIQQSATYDIASGSADKLVQNPAIALSDTSIHLGKFKLVKTKPFHYRLGCSPKRQCVY